MPATATPDALAASHYHYDITGSTVALSGDDGSVKGRVSYTPYGEITSKDAGVDTRFLFCGAYGVQTDASGLIHMRARYYHPYLCRFLNEDPIEFGGGMNWYAYANGNPLNFVDPTGHVGSGIIPTADGWVNGWTGERGYYTGAPGPSFFDQFAPPIGPEAGAVVDNARWIREQRFPETTAQYEALFGKAISNGMQPGHYNLRPDMETEFGNGGYITTPELWFEGNIQYGNIWLHVRNIQAGPNNTWTAEVYATDGLGFDVGDRASGWFEREIQGPIFGEPGLGWLPGRDIERGSWEIHGTYESKKNRNPKPH